MPGESLTSIVVQQGRDLAFVVGNGINRYGNGIVSSSWDESPHQVVASAHGQSRRKHTQADEIFLRWLLIERAKYFQMFPNRSKPAWYVSAGGKQRVGQKLFLTSVGIGAVEVQSYSEIYDAPWRLAE